MQVTRHYLTVGDGTSRRRVHYRKCGEGPPLLMIHQSPCNSGEYEPLMREWGAHFTCIAPDTPGFGMSDPLPHENPQIEDYAAAVGEFIDAAGIAPTLAYGFHSGGIILVSMIKQRPELVRALAIGGYAIWTDEEMRIFGESYLPPFVPQPHGEHLAWLWHRMLEQTWFFPWFDKRDEARLTQAHDDVERVATAVGYMLDAGDHYRTGYGAVLRAPRDIPEPDTGAPPCLVTAYDADPLQAHIDRLGELPANWEARKVALPPDHRAASLEFLLSHAESGATDFPEDSDAGFVALGNGLIHWQGKRGARTLRLHAPASEMDVPGPDEIAIDVPGHGQSDDFEDIEQAVRDAAEALGAAEIDWPDAPAGDPEKLYPDVTPDRFGAYLHRAWSAARAEAVFAPWYEAVFANGIPVATETLTAEAVHQRARARIRAGDAARRWHEVLESKTQ